MRFLKDNRGIESTEVALIIAVVVLVAYGAYRLLGANIAAIVTNEYRTRQIVLPNSRTNFIGLRPSNSPEISPEINNPVPVADNQFSANTASSALGCKTTGGTRNT